MTDDYLGAQRAMVERLRQQAPGLRSVEASCSPTGPQSVALRPAALVTHEEFSSLGRDNGITLAMQKWKITLMVPAFNDRLGSDGLHILGQLAAQVVQALAGWSPGSGYSSMELLSCGGEELNEGSVLLHLRFQTIGLV